MQTMTDLAHTYGIIVEPILSSQPVAAMLMSDLVGGAFATIDVAFILPEQGLP